MYLIASKILTELSPVNLNAMDVGLQTVNIFWSSLSLPLPLTTRDINETFKLTVISTNTQPLLLELDERSYVFSSPDGTPPCEIYNISVLATYHEIAGVTYTGPGCSVSTRVLQRMLPSLPDISKLESSLTYTLKKDSSGNVTLRLFFSVSEVRR